MKLSELITKETIEIPGTGIKITVRTDMTWFEFLAMCKIEDPVERGIYSVRAMLESWQGLEDDDGKPLEVNEKNIRELPTTVMQYVADRLDKYVRDRKEKKTP